MTVPANIHQVHGIAVEGVDVDPQTRCRHYHGEKDIIAIRFRCCGRWFPCFECHSEMTDHKAGVWPAGEFKERAILCGACGHRLSIKGYLTCDSVCTNCGSSFNPGCAKHYHLYFDRSDEVQVEG